MIPPLPAPGVEAVTSALAALHLRFAHVPRPVHRVGCRCCADRVDLPRLLATPAEALTGEDLLPFALKALTTVGGTAELVALTPRLLELQLADALGVDDELLLGKLGLATLTGWATSLRDAVLAVLGAELARRLAFAPETVDAWWCGLALATGTLGPWLRAVDEGPLAVRTAAVRLRHAVAEGAVPLGRSAFWPQAREARSELLAWLSPPSTEVLAREVLAEEPGYFVVHAAPDGALTLTVDRERGAGVVETASRRLSDAEADAVWRGDPSVARRLADTFEW